MTDEQTLAWHYWNSLRTAALTDLPRACARFGVQLPLAERVAGLTLEEMGRLALEVDVVILKPSISRKQLDTILKAARATRGPQAMRVVARMAVGPGDGHPTSCTQDDSFQQPQGERNHG